MAPSPRRPLRGASDRHRRAAEAYPRWREDGRPRACTALTDRLRCVDDVLQGKLSIAQACAQRDVSTRTYYRWLAQRHRIERLLGRLGHKEEDEEEEEEEEGEGEGEGEREGGGHVHAARVYTHAHAHAVETGRKVECKVEHEVEHGGRQHMPQHMSQHMAEHKAKLERGRRAVAIAPRPHVAECAGRGEGAGEMPSPSPGHSAGGEGSNSAPAAATAGGRVRRYLGEGAAAGVRRAGREPAGAAGADGGRGRRRIVVRHDGRSVSFVWFEGATAAEVKRTIAARFWLGEDTFFNLRAEDGEVLVVSEGVPSGTYDLLL